MAPEALCLSEGAACSHGQLRHSTGIERIASSGRYLISLLPGASGMDTESWVGGLNSLHHKIKDLAAILDLAAGYRGHRRVPDMVRTSRGTAIGRRSRSSICGSSRKIRGPRTRYRFRQFLGFWTRRNSHSNPDCRIQSGARFSAPVMKLIEAPIHKARPRATPRSLSFCAMISC